MSLVQQLHHHLMMKRWMPALPVKWASMILPLVWMWNTSFSSLREWICSVLIDQIPRVQCPLLREVGEAVSEAGEPEGIMRYGMSIHHTTLSSNKIVVYVSYCKAMLPSLYGNLFSMVVADSPNVRRIHCLEVFAELTSNFWIETTCSTWRNIQTKIDKSWLCFFYD